MTTRSLPLPVLTSDRAERSSTSCGGFDQAVLPMVWEERWHPLREEWLIVAAHRQNRPWSGAIVNYETVALPHYVDDCYLCPGNARVSGQVNEKYTGIFVFDNDHPCVGPDAPEPQPATSEIFHACRAQGS